MDSFIDWTSKERISELEYRAVKISQSEIKETRIKNKIEKNIQELWDNMKRHKYT